MQLKRAKKIPTQARSREKVALMLDTARQIIINEGIQALTTNRIAEYSGITVGSIYQYFPDKEAIAYEVYSQVLDGLYARYRDYSAAHQEETDAATFFIGAVKHFSIEDESDHRFWRQLRLAVQHDADLAELDATHDARICAALFEDALRLGVVDDNAEGRRKVRFAFSMLLHIEEIIGEADETDRGAYMGYVENVLRLILAFK